MNIARNIEYTKQLFLHAGKIKDELARLTHRNDVKSFDEVMEDFLQFIWQYNSVDKSIHRFWASFDEVIQRYFEQYIHLKGRNPSDFILQDEYYHYLYDFQKKSRKLCTILDHKNLFQPYFQERGYPVTKRIGTLTIKDNKPEINTPDGSCHSLGHIVTKYKGLFCKPILDTWGKGCIKLIPGSEEDNYYVNGKAGGDKSLIEAVPHTPPPVYC